MLDTDVQAALTGLEPLLGAGRRTLLEVPATRCSGTAQRDPARVDPLAPSVPIRRAGEPDEVAAAIAWLLSDEAPYVTVAVLDEAGGR